MFYADFWVINSQVMISTKLVKILKTFSREEIKAFETFLLSPFFNTTKNYIRFYKELAKFYPDFKSSLLTAEHIFSRLFPGKPFSIHTMWNLSSGLEKLAEEFLTQSSLKNQPFEKLKLTIRELGLKRLDKLYLKKLNEMEKMLQNALIDDVYFLKLIELKEFESSFLQKVKGRESIAAECNIEKAEIYTLDYLINIYRVIGIIATYSETTNLKKPYNVSEDFVQIIDLERILDISKKKNYKYANLIEFYSNLILCITYTENEKYYFNAKDFLFKNHKLFDKYEKRNLVIILVNFCSHKYLLGDPDFALELFLIFKFRVKHDLAAYENGKISKSFYNFAVFSAASVKEIQWAKKFIEKYTPLLFEEYREEMKNLANAYVYFNTGKFHEVLDSLKRFKYTDAIDKIHVKNLVARTYFEMKEFEPLLYHIDSTKHFLKKNKKLGNYIRDVNSNFVSYLYSIVTAIEKDDTNRLIQLKENISRDNKVNYKIWLLEKLSEIEQKNPPRGKPGRVFCS